MKKILSDSRREKFAYNEDKFIRVNLDSNQGMLPVSEITSSLDEYYQYFAEHDASNIYRLIFTINPICSNVLFNNITEIVYNEGGDDNKDGDGCVFFGKSQPIGTVPGEVRNYSKSMGKSLSRYNLIRDTAYSHAKIGPLVYHCGADIFNNHTLRRREFTVINKNTEESNKSVFNTVSDYLRDRNGKYVKDYKYQKDGVLSKFERHLYTTDTIKPYSVAIDDNLIEENGWFGYKNQTTLDIDNFTVGEEEISINKCMNNNKAGEFIDMYPDRSLYSFLPKYNKHRDRQEYNWEYCLTYPYENYDDNELITINGYNGPECVPLISDIVYLSDDNKVIYFKTYVKHNLTESSRVRIAIFSGDTLLVETSASIPIVSVGSGGYDRDHYFSVRLGDIMALMNEVGESIINAESIAKFNFRFAKYVNGCRCKYYFRKFRKLPNFFGSNVYQDENITDEEIDEAISKKKQAFNTTLNKMAFAENVFSDKLAEIVFNDDINTTGLKDNLGRPLSEIYLTIIKTNYGHEEWYDYDNPKYSSKTIEFSHCFSKITSGLDMENGKSEYNVHRLHNISIDDNLRNIAPYIPEPVEAIEDDITIKNKIFFGDLVELSPYTLEETTLENVYHRFNTAQREYYKDSAHTEFYDIHYDDIIFDDFDIAQTVNGDTLSGFTVRKVGYCRVKKDESSSESVNQFPGNLAAEGYYYQPHYKIKLREYSPETSWGSNQNVIFEITEANDNKNIYYIHTSKNYYFNVKDPVILYNKKTLKRIKGEIISVEGKYFTEIGMRVGLESGKTLDDYLLFKVNPIRPSTAYDLDDGTGRYVWRDFLPAREMTSDDELYDVPFVNGAHYIHKYINFYLRRQDPYGIYGMSFGLKGGTPLPLLNLIVPGNEKDIDIFDYVENTGITC